MSKNPTRRLAALCYFGIALCSWGNAFALQSESLGIFEGQSDVGTVKPSGTLHFDSARETYTITAAGANIWSTVDAFHYVWKKVSGDVSLSADIAFPESSAASNPHRKAVLLFRQSLDSDGVYADAAQHGSGLTALQYRRSKGDTTQDIELNIDAPKRLRLEKRDDIITMFLSMHGEPLHQAGASIKLPFDGTFYAGIGLCSHNENVVEKAVFSNVVLKPLEPLPATANLTLYSTLKTIQIDESARVATVIVSKPAQLVEGRQLSCV